MLTEKISKLNYNNFLWHAAFLALASSFMDVDTIMPSMLGAAGGKALQMGILVTIMVGGSSFSQILFAPFLHNKRYKKKFLLIGIYARVLALSGLALLFLFFKQFSNLAKIWAVLLLVSLFSFSGAFANISYTDILGKSVKKEKRKSLLSLKQVVSATGVFVSAIIARKLLSIYNIPLNYSILFLFAAVFLAIASLGFWRLKEVKGRSEYVHDLRQFFSFMKKEIKQNQKLRTFLLIINTLGISRSLLPFLILFAKEFSVKVFLGNLLMIKVTGGILMGFLLFHFSKKFRYSHTFYIVVLLSIGLLPFAFFSQNLPWLFYIAFFLGGISFAAYSITINGVLLEITDNENRAMYTGLAGAGNIIPALFPLFGGWLIKTSGFTVFFLIVGAIMLSSTIFIRKLACKH